MPNIIDSRQLKDVVKEALVEIMQERRDLLRDLFEEALEDLALARAMEEGRQTAIIGRHEVFSILEGVDGRPSSGPALPETCAQPVERVS